MALTLKLEGNVEEIMKALDDLERKTTSTVRKIEVETKKMNKDFDKSKTNLMLAGGAAVAFFWGIAQVSPVLNTYMGILKNALGAIFDQLFIAMMPLFKPLLELLWDFAKWLQEQPDWVKALMGAITLLIPVLWSFNAAMAANPIGAVAAAIGLLIAALAYLYTNWENIKIQLDELKEKHWALALVIDGLVFYFETLWHAAEAVWWWFSQVFKVYEVLIGGFLDGFGKFAEWIGLTKQLSKEWEALQDLWSQFSGHLGKEWEAAGNLWKSFTEQLGKEWDKLGELYDVIAGWIGDAFSWGWDMMVNFAQGIADGAVAVYDALAGVGQGIVDWIGFDIPKNDNMAMRWGEDLGYYFSKGLGGSLADIGLAVPNTYGGGAGFGGTSTTTNYGGSTSISISVEGNTFREQADIDYLVEEISRKLQLETERSV